MPWLMKADQHQVLQDAKVMFDCLSFNAKLLC